MSDEAQHNYPISERFRIVAKLLDRKSSFESRLIPEPNSGCWLWLGMQQVGKLYGIFCWKNKSIKAHRASWEIYRGEIPLGLQVLHRCDMPQCVNPDHLFLGTQKDNNDDCHRKGRNRSAVGEKQHLSKLTASNVLEIRTSPYCTLEKLGDKYGVTKSTIGRVLSRKTWKHV